MSVSGQEQRLLWWDADKNEPYLAVPGFPDLRITPFRKEDDPHLVSVTLGHGSWVLGFGSWVVGSRLHLLTSTARHPPRERVITSSRCP
jgi:hypothetical protein